MNHNNIVPTLKNICMGNMVNIIKNIPPLLQEEIIKKSTKTIEKEARKKAHKKVHEKIIKEIRYSFLGVIEDTTRDLIEAHITGNYIRRPEYTKNMNDELYNICVNISKQFVQHYGEQLIFNNSQHNLQHNMDDSDNEF
jgi:hypothetical protein